MTVRLARVVVTAAIVLAAGGCALPPPWWPTATQAKPFATDGAVTLITGKPLLGHLYDAFTPTGCDRFEDPIHRSRCEARNAGPRSRNR